MTRKKYNKIYISVDEAKSLGLPNRISGKTIREDGYIFKQYYYLTDDMGFKSKPLEMWNSSDAIKRNKIRKAVDKKDTSNRNKKFSSCNKRGKTTRSISNETVFNKNIKGGNKKVCYILC
mgnify:CR=1 FL=1